MILRRGSRSFLIGIAVLFVLLFFYIFIMRPQIRRVEKERAIVSELTGRVTAQKALQATRQKMDRDYSSVKSSVETLKAGYFVPFIQEDLLLMLTEMMAQYGITATDIQFSEHERVTLEIDKANETQAEEPFPGKLENLEENDLYRVEPGEGYLEQAVRYYHKALELMERSPTDQPGSDIMPKGYTLERVMLQVEFGSESIGRVKDFVHLLEQSRPYFRIASINLSAWQIGWAGHMEIHAFTVPNFPKTGEADE